MPWLMKGVDNKAVRTVHLAYVAPSETDLRKCNNVDCDVGETLLTFLVIGMTAVRQSRAESREYSDWPRLCVILSA